MPMPSDPQEQPRSEPPYQRRCSPRILDLIDNVAKFATPIAIIGAAIAGAVIANRVQTEISTSTLRSQRQISGTTLLSEREKAESQLRASMFGSLIEPIIGSPKGGLIPLDREQLLVELLALNFHEHFEMKPLFQRVDARLAAMRDKSAQERRAALRSIARRIIDRQTAMFQKEEDGGRSDKQKAHVYSLTIVEEPKEQDEKQQRYLEMLKKGGSKVYQVGDLIDDLATPDQRHRFTMVISQADWDKQEFIAEVYESPSMSNGPNADQAHTTRYPIGLTWFDFPLTDNTLFPDGNRFSVVLYNVLERDPLRNMTLKFIVFPRNYFTPRERPFDQDEFLRLVGKERD
jgi:hypothetical protein